VWDFLFKYPAQMFSRGEIVLSGSLWLYLALVAAAAVVIPTLLKYRRATRPIAAADRAVLTLARLVVVAILLLALFQPVLSVANIISERTTVAVLLDDSVSMRIADEDGAARAAFVHSAFHPDSGAVSKALGQHRDPVFFRFSSDVSTLGAGRSMTFAGARTELGHALEELGNQIDLHSLAALVVVTDGAVTRGTALDAKLSAYRAADVPITTVGVGEPAFSRDIEVSAVSLPRRTLEGSSIVADVTITQRGFDGDTVKLLIEDDGEPTGVETITLGSGEPVHTLRTRFTASDAGPRRLRFSIAPAEGEMLTENNARETVLEVEGDEQRILYFEGEPRFELKFLRRAVAQDENLRVVTMVRTAENKYYRLGIENPEELADGFPKTAEELFAYRGLILGSVEAGYFDAAQLELIAEFVSRRGGGLLMLGGRHALSSGGYANTPVGEVLPVILDDSRDEPIAVEVSVHPTPAGYGHPIGGIAVAEDGSPSWKGLPPLKVLHPLTRAKPGAAVLLEGGARELPGPLAVLAEQRFGRGQALVLNVQNAWAWQMHHDVPLEDQTHETLWRQLLRWLVRDVPDAITIRTGIANPSPGESVEITAEVLDPAFRPHNGAHVSLTANTPIGDRTTLPMQWDAAEDGIYRARLVPEHAGLYEITVEARSGETVTTSTTNLSVGIVVPDNYRAELRESLLQHIADATGGRYLRAADVSALADALPVSTTGSSVQQRLVLWDMPIVFLAVLALIGFEWLYRRLRGLV